MATKAFSESRLARMHEILASHIESGRMPGLVSLVSRGGEVHVDAIGKTTTNSNTPMQRDSIFRIASMTKPVAAAAAMILVEECVLRLDDPVDTWLPEFSTRRVLNKLDGALDDTVAAKRAITMRDLLTMRMGLGYIMFEDASTYPIRKALDEINLLVGPPSPSAMPTPDAWMKQVGALPLMYQPGEQWMYDISLDVLGVLIARASGKPLDVFLRERLFEPLGMKDTGFYVPAEKLARFTGCYVGNASGGLDEYDGVDHSQWGAPPPFPSAAGGLVSTVDDYHAFCRMLLNKGMHRSEQILSRASVDMMTSNQVGAEHRTNPGAFLEPHSGWGFGMGVDVRRDQLWTNPGRFGWDGGLGTSGYSDPNEDLVGILLTTRMMDSPEPPRAFVDFWTSAYSAIGE